MLRGPVGLCHIRGHVHNPLGSTSNTDTCSDTNEKLYTYTIITTDSNKQLSWLHDRMPVILNNGSDDMFTWLDSKRSEWSKELQSLLKPFEGELECYPVSKDVGKVGNDSVRRCNLSRSAYANGS